MEANRLKSSINREPDTLNTKGRKEGREGKGRKKGVREGETGEGGREGGRKRKRRALTLGGAYSLVV